MVCVSLPYILNVLVLTLFFDGEGRGKFSPFCQFFLTPLENSKLFFSRFPDLFTYK